MQYNLQIVLFYVLAEITEQIGGRCVIYTIPLPVPLSLLSLPLSKKD